MASVSGDLPAHLVPIGELFALGKRLLNRKMHLDEGTSFAGNVLPLCRSDRETQTANFAH